MIFLSVFCVVLYFQSGDLFQVYNNALQSQNQNHGLSQSNSQRNVALPSLNNGYNNVPESQINTRFIGQINSQEPRENLRIGPPHIVPEYINSEQFKHVNERLNQELHSAYINSQELRSIRPEERNFNDVHLTHGDINYRATSNLESSLHYVPDVNPEIQSHIMHPKNINTQSINIENLAPLSVNEDTKLELQGIPPELIESMIKQNNLKPKTLDSVQSYVTLPNSYKNIKNIEVRKPFDNNEYRLHQDKAKFENPSAEILYDMNQALPYNIRSQQLPNNFQDHASFKNNVPNLRRIEDIIRSTVPVKRYMIIYPGGRVEHADDIEKITKIYPNYMMIKSQDILNHLSGKVTIPGLQIPVSKAVLPLNTQQVTAINQNLAQNLAVEKKKDEVLLSQIPSKPIVSKDMVTKVSIVPSKANVLPSITPSALDVISKNDTSSPINISQPGINMLLNKEISPNVTNTVPSTITQKDSDLKSKLTITHSLPIIKTQEISNIEYPSQNFTNVSDVLNSQEKDIISTTPLSITQLLVTEKSDEIKNLTDVGEIKFNITTNSTIQLQNKEKNYTSEESSEYGSSSIPPPETISVNQVNNNDLSTMSGKSTAKTDSSTESVKNDSNLLGQPHHNNMTNITDPHNQLLSNINNNTLKYISNNISTSNETEISTQSPMSYPNETEIPFSENEFSINTNITMSDISSDIKNMDSPLATISNSSLWIQADDLFWKNITSNNNAQNMFYFLFIPPKPSVVQKETKTTIYANGTTVEEISETRDENGVPIVVRTTKVSYANSTSTDL